MDMSYLKNDGLCMDNDMSYLKNDEVCMDMSSLKDDCVCKDMSFPIMMECLWTCRI